MRSKCTELHPHRVNWAHEKSFRSMELFFHFPLCSRRRTHPVGASRSLSPSKIMHWSRDACCLSHKITGGFFKRSGAKGPLPSGNVSGTGLHTAVFFMDNSQPLKINWTWQWLPLFLQLQGATFISINDWPKCLTSFCFQTDIRGHEKCITQYFPCSALASGRRLLLTCRIKDLVSSALRTQEICLLLLLGMKACLVLSRSVSASWGQKWG